jgi:hypothetical protein
MVGAILGRHPHQHMDKADAAADGYIGSIGSMGAKRVRHPVEFAAADRLVIEAQHARDTAHVGLPVNSLQAAECGKLREAAVAIAAYDFMFANLDPGMSGKVAVAACDAEA